VLGAADLDGFIRRRQWAVMTTLREASIKVRCVENDPRVTLCVFSDDAHPRFATIEGRGTVERRGLEQAKKKVLSNTIPRGHTGARIEAWLRRRTTLILRVRATRVWGELNPTA
jgi:hypothetical protein